MSKIGYTDNVNLPVLEEIEDCFQATAFKLARVIDANDEEGTKWRLESPSEYGEGVDRLSPWAEQAGLPIGTSSKKMSGDCGIWWPPVVGQYVLTGCINGNPQHPFFIPGPPCLDGSGKGKAMLPKEVKSVADNKSVRESTRIRMLKSESGHTLMFCDNEGEEGAFLMDNVGQAIFFMSPSKGKGEKETLETKASISRKGERREDRSCLDGTCKKPGECTKNGLTYCGFSDINGSGLFCTGTDNEGNLLLKASRYQGDQDSLSIVMDTKNNQIILTAGETQFVIDGKRGHTYSTSQIVQEQIKIDMKPLLSKIYNEMKDYYKKILGKSGGSSSSQSGGSSSSQSGNGSGDGFAPF